MRKSSVACGPAREGGTHKYFPVHDSRPDTMRGMERELSFRPLVGVKFVAHKQEHPDHYRPL